MCYLTYLQNVVPNFVVWCRGSRAFCIPHLLRGNKTHIGKKDNNHDVCYVVGKSVEREKKKEEEYDLKFSPKWVKNISLRRREIFTNAHNIPRNPHVVQ